MTSYLQPPESFDWLTGATITAIERGELGLALYLKLPETVALNNIATRAVVLEVWSDEEGNGPGYLALVAGTLAS